MPNNRHSLIALVFSAVVVALAACSGGSSPDLSSGADAGNTSSSGAQPDGASGDDSGTSGSSGASGSSGSSGTSGTSGTSGSSGSSGSSGTSGSSGSSGSSGITYTSAVKIIVEPSDNGQALVDAINAAKTSVHVTMYLLTYNGPVYKALIASKSRVDVKVVLNQNFPNGQGSNAQTYSGLKAAGISVVWAPGVYTFTHEKCIILDSATAWIMTMNATDSSPSQNREYLAVDTDADDVKRAEAVFQADFTGAAVNASGKLVLAPVDAKPMLQALIATATKSIVVEGEEFSDIDLTNTLAAKADAGVAVRLVVADNTPTPAQATAVSTLKAHKVPVKSVSKPYIHAKAIVVDGVRAYVGSANFTSGSMTGNRELGVLFDTAAEVAKVSATIGTDFAAGLAL